MSEVNAQKALVIMTFGGIVAALAFFLIPFLVGGGPSPETAQQVGHSARVSQCGFAVKSECSVELSSPSFDCSKDDVDIRSRLRRQLSDMLSRPECQKQQGLLARKCGDSCVFDYSSMIAVPTRIDTEFIKESELLCRVSATRSVKISSVCIDSN